MQLHFARVFKPLAIFSALACCIQAGAQTPIVDNVHTVATAVVPVEHDFQITAAGTYTVTLTDLGAQIAAPGTAVPLASLALALTTDDALVGTPLTVEGTGAATTGTAGVGTLTFTAASATYPVTYRLHVVGTPASNHGAGPISVQITSGGSTNTGTVPACSTASGTPTPPCSWNDLIGPPATAVPPTIANLQDSFTLGTAGSYQISLTDLALPQALAPGTLTLLLVNSGASFIQILPDPSNSNATQETVSLPAGNYQVYAVGQVASGASGGLFSFVVAPGGGGTPVYDKTVPLGITAQLGTPTLTAGSYTFGVTDLAFPAALAQLNAALVINGQLAASVSAGQSTAVTATSGLSQVFAAATPASGAGASGAGSYVAQLSQSGAAVFSVAQGVVTPGGAVSAYAFNVNVAAGGSYTAALSDFQVPSNLAVGRLAVVQGGALVGNALTAPGTSTVTLSAAPATVLAFARGGSAGSTFDVSLTDSGGTYLLDQPLGVGVAFSATQVAIPSSGSYDFTLGDLQWPAPFGTLTGIVTQGGTVIGQIYGGGTLNAIQAGQGNYYINILAVPAAGSSNTSNAGTYVLNVSQAPAAPSVTLTASPTSVASGGTVQLSWTVTNATSCTASGGNWSGTFTGAQAASGSATSPAITTATTFTLTCTGTSGTGSGTATVSLKSASSSGGGGSVDGLTFAALALILALRSFARRTGTAL